MIGEPTLIELANSLGIPESEVESMRNDIFESRNLDPLGAFECNMVEDSLYDDLLEIRMDFDSYYDMVAA